MKYNLIFSQNISELGGEILWLQLFVSEISDHHRRSQFYTALLRTAFHWVLSFISQKPEAMAQANGFGVLNFNSFGHATL